MLNILQNGRVLHHLLEIELELVHEALGKLSKGQRQSLKAFLEFIFAHNTYVDRLEKEQTSLHRIWHVNLHKSLLDLLANITEQ